MDEVADIVVTTLSATTPAARPSKAHYTLDAVTAGAGRTRSAQLLASHPLYPELLL
jgi:glycine hydroxymethyltransferase